MGCVVGAQFFTKRLPVDACYSCFNARAWIWTVPTERTRGRQLVRRRTVWTEFEVNRKFTCSLHVSDVSESAKQNAYSGLVLDYRIAIHVYAHRYTRGHSVLVGIHRYCTPKWEHDNNIN